MTSSDSTTLSPQFITPHTNQRWTKHTHRPARSGHSAGVENYEDAGEQRRSHQSLTNKALGLPTLLSVRCPSLTLSHWLLSFLYPPSFLSVSFSLSYKLLFIVNVKNIGHFVSLAPAIQSSKGFTFPASKLSRYLTYVCVCAYMHTYRIYTFYYIILCICMQFPPRKKKYQ